ncbi:MAG: EamA family transporter [Bacteroidia bacterium]|nr:EamA family transporter [Bacteroidia bacterium]
MIYLILSIITSVIVVSYFKLFDIYKVNTFQAIVVNYFTCAVMGNLMTDTPGITTNFWVEEWFGYTLIIGFLFISVFYSIGQTAQKFGLSVSMVAAKLSVAIPVLIAVFFQNETLGSVKFIGILLSLTAVFFISKSNSTQNQNGLWYFPVFVFLGSGLIDTILNLVNKKYIPPFDTNHILSFAFLTAFVLGGAILAYQAITKKQQLNIKSTLWGVALGIPNYFCMYFLLKTLGAFNEASLVLPINNIGIVLVTALVGLIIFKEHLSKTNWAGFVLAIVSILLLSFS